MTVQKAENEMKRMRLSRDGVFKAANHTLVFLAKRGRQPAAEISEELTSVGKVLLPIVGIYAKEFAE